LVSRYINFLIATKNIWAIEDQVIV